MRDLLGRFGLTGDQVDQRVGDLSGGEHSRAALARLVVLGVNVLVLDEPTNHLDLWACDALEQALLEFDGTVIVVSHDRYFLNRVVDLLIVLEGDGQSTVIHGNYDTYERMVALQEGTDKETRRQGDKETQETQASKVTLSPCHPVTLSPLPARPKRNASFPIEKQRNWRPTSPSAKHACASWNRLWRRPTCTVTATESRRPCVLLRKPRPGCTSFMNIGKKRWS